MAYDANALRVVAHFAAPADGAANPVFATYITADATATVTTANYFNAAVAQLPLGSVIMVVSSYGGTEVVNPRVVGGNDGTTVTIA